MARALTLQSIGEFLRCSVGLSAWKQFGRSRWALRVSPSSGNLHPTEAYVVVDGGIFHYAPRDHLLEERSHLGGESWRALTPSEPGFLVALTSIHWREAWKYGERAFRYCHHDVGHAIGALSCAAALLGWRFTLLPRWSDAQIEALLGVDRREDYGDAEVEVADCIGAVTPLNPSMWLEWDGELLVEAARRAAWQGVANRLSTTHVDWPIIDEVAAATRYPGRAQPSVPAAVRRRTTGASGRNPRDIILRRRSALAFDAATALPAQVFLSLLARVQPAGAPWDTIDWQPHVHLVLFVHRVDGLLPGIYAYVRDAAVVEQLKEAMRPEFLWEPPNVSNVSTDPNAPNGLFLLAPLDVRQIANRLSCDQDIAADGFFSLAMMARLEGSLSEQGSWFYPRLFWECGLIGQVLYLEAGAAGARATGIGCYYDDPVHETLGIEGRSWQSLYHFSMGMPIEDPRLTNEPGYHEGHEGF